MLTINSFYIKHKSFFVKLTLHFLKIMNMDFTSVSNRSFFCPELAQKLLNPHKETETNLKLSCPHLICNIFVFKVSQDKAYEEKFSH